MISVKEALAQFIKAVCIGLIVSLVLSLIMVIIGGALLPNLVVVVLVGIAFLSLGFQSPEVGGDEGLPIFIISLAATAIPIFFMIHKGYFIVLHRLVMGH